MAFLRKASNGDYYVCKVVPGNRIRTSTDMKAYQNWWLPKYSGYCLSVTLCPIKIPKEMEGKKVRFKAEFFD